MRADILNITVLFIAALLFRLFRLFDLDVWFDEVAILLQLDMSFGEIWNFCKIENFPPFYPWIAKAWNYIFPGDQSLRLLSAIIGALVPPAAYFLGKEVKDQKFGILLGFACVVSLPLIYYSQVVRMYGLFVLLGCISYTSFIRGMKTNEWKYWVLTAFANLLAFYTFLFAVFIIASEFAVLSWVFRLQFKRYFRPVMAHLPAVAVMSLWLLTVIERYGIVQSYQESQNIFRDIFVVWIFWGSGIYYLENHLLAVLVNLPILIGFALSLKLGYRDRTTGIIAGLLLLAFSIIMVISIGGVDILDARYQIFLVPLYLGLAIIGWLGLKKNWYWIGIIAIYCSLIGSTSYYFYHYLPTNDAYRYHGTFSHGDNDDGRCYSRMAAELEKRIAENEIIIHYSSPLRRSFTFFNFIYFHKRAYPEYIFSIDEISYAKGRQYLQPGERLRSLSDLGSRPVGIWIVTLNNPDILFNALNPASKTLDSRETWVDREDLPGELREFGYTKIETIRDGSMALVHFHMHEKSGSIQS